MSKSLKKTTDRLRTHPIASLSGDEIYQYFSYRLDKLLQRKCIVTPGELKYLFGETGQGSFRIDPDILSAMTSEKYYVSNTIDRVKDSNEYSGVINNIIKEKMRIENSINNDCRRLEQDDKIKNILKCYVKNIKFDAQKNIYTGNCFNIPVCITFGNGEWMLPKQDIINFLAITKNMKALPIFIYKKIHGSLFPLFKQVSALGLSTYVTFVSHSTYTDFKKFNKKYEFNKKQIDRKIEELPFLLENLAYNDRLCDAGAALKEAKKRQEIHFYNFFEKIIPKLGPRFYEDSLTSDLNLNGNFSDLLSSIKIRKIRKNLLDGHNNREELLRSLAYLTPTT